MLFLPYINDNFMIGNGTNDQLQVFLKKPKKQHTTIKTDCKILNKEIAFLDTKIYIDDNKNIQATVYQKKTSSKFPTFKI